MLDYSKSGDCMDIEARFQTLERRISLWQLLFLVQTAFLAGLGGLYLHHPRSTVAASENVLRVHGIVIEDDAGRARILLGSPLPGVADRLRKDSAYDAMVFLDEHGHDRISLGEILPAQIMGAVPTNKHRISQGYGFMINDTLGNERGGFSFLDVGRATMALDRPNGDAWAALVDDHNNFAGTVSLYDKQLGDGATGVFSGTQGKRAFIDIKGLDDKPRGEFSVGANQKASFQLYDANGDFPRELLKDSTQPPER